MELVTPLAAFAGCLLLTARGSLGAGLAGVLAVGYVNGVVRANVLGVLTTFMFDAAVAGLYLGAAAARWDELTRAAGTRTGRWVLFLTAWPAVLAAVPVNHPLVQLVALRGTVWYVPVLLLATRLTADDLDRLARAAAGLNLLALAAGAYTYAYGPEALFPENAVTQIMYRSRDVAGGNFRVPSLFLHAHAYGGTMLLTLPLVVDPLVRPGGRAADRLAGAAGTLAAVAGLLLCAARLPVVLGVLAAVVFWAVTRFAPRVGAAILVLAAGGGYLAVSNERFQRAAEVADVEAVQSRVYGSANEVFLDLLAEYPLGAGMGSSVGTSVPYFLADHAPAPVGLENEFSRILVDQGWVGLGGWVGFVVWLLAVPPGYDPRRRWAAGRGLMYALVLVTWATGFIGTGVLAAVPGSVLLLAYMGVLAAGRDARPGGRR
jgi:hypothetical protein